MTQAGPGLVNRTNLLPLLHLPPATTFPPLPTHTQHKPSSSIFCSTSLSLLPLILNMEQTPWWTRASSQPKDRVRLPASVAAVKSHRPGDQRRGTLFSCRDWRLVWVINKCKLPTKEQSRGEGLACEMCVCVGGGDAAQICPFIPTPRGHAQALSPTTLMTLGPHGSWARAGDDSPAISILE